MDFTQRQTDIIKATLDIIAEKSLDALSIRAIARKVGITEPAVYRHFRTKEDLFVKLAIFFRQNWADILKTMRDPSLPGIGELEYMLSSCVKNFSLNEVYPSFFISIEKLSSSPRIKAEMQEILKLVILVLEEPIARGQREGNIRSDIKAADLSQLVLSMVMSLLFYWKLSGEKQSFMKKWKESWDLLHRVFTHSSP